MFRTDVKPGNASMAASNLSWTPPPFDALNLTSNCSLFGPFVADISRTGFYSAPIDLTTTFLRSTLPAAFNPSPSDSQLLEWWNVLTANYTADPTSKYNILGSGFVAANTTCRDEFCAAIDLEGNPDVAGVGVMIAYAIEASLVSCYCLAMAVYQIRRHSLRSKLHKRLMTDDVDPDLPKPRPGGASNRLFDAFRGSITNFWNSAAIVCLAITVVSVFFAKNSSASAGELAEAWKSGGPVLLYDDQLATIASTFAFFPVLLLSLLGKNRHRRRWLKRLVLLALYILMLVQLRVSAAADALDLEATTGSLVRACDAAHVDRIFRKFADPMFFLLVIAPGAIALVTGVVAAIFMARRGGVPMPKLPHPHSRTLAPYLPGWYKKSLRVFIGFASFCLMWATLGWLLFVRRAIIQAGGGTGDVREWGFGQLLVLATWLPVLIEWGYIFAFGLKTGIESHLPQEYAVIYQALPSGDPVYEESLAVGLERLQRNQAQHAYETGYGNGYANGYHDHFGRHGSHTGFARAGRDSFEQD